MSRRRRAFGILALLGAVVGSALGAGATLTAVGVQPAGADPIGACTASSGVIVVVDFAPWGGNIERGCDATPITGYDALHAAGFTTAGDQHDGPAFICRIDDDPPPSQDACIVTPPATAYWSYWHANAGQDTWSYSQLGAMSYHPQPGSVDAWVFGATDIQGTTGQPTFTPAQVRATNTTPTGGSNPASPTTSPPARTPPPSSGASGHGTGGTAPPPAVGSKPGSSAAPGSGAHVSGSSGAGRSTRTGTAPGSGSDPSPTTSPSSPSSATASGKKGSSSRSGPRIVDASPAVARSVAAGSPLPMIVGAAVVIVLAGVGGVEVWRRRRLGHTEDG